MQAHCQQQAPAEEKERLNVEIVVGCRRVASDQPPSARKRSGVWRQLPVAGESLATGTQQPEGEVVPMSLSPRALAWRIGAENVYIAQGVPAPDRGQVQGGLVDRAVHLSHSP